MTDELPRIPDRGARAGDATARSLGVREASRRFDEALLAARGEGRAAPGGAPGRGVPVSADPRHERGLGDAARPDRAQPAAPLAAAARAAADLVPVCCPAPASIALRAAVRALPPVIEAARLRDGARLALTLGGALAVDLRGGAAGVEVTLRPEAALGQAAAAELPALVAALRARGVRVARAELALGARRSPAAPGRQAR